MSGRLAESGVIDPDDRETIRSTWSEPHQYTEHAEIQRLLSVIDAVDDVLAEYERYCNPAPYTSERALYERLRNVILPPAGGASDG